MGGFISSLFGFDDAPEVQYQPLETQEDQKGIKKLRSALFETQGGSAGQEILSGQTSRRNTLFGN